MSGPDSRWQDRSHEMAGSDKRNGRTSQKRWQDQSEEMAGTFSRDGRTSQKR